MEFWGEEVKPGSKIACTAGEGYVIHLSQAALGETKKGSENVVVSVRVDNKKLVIGTLSVEKHPQIMCDLIFEKDFEVFHNSKTTTVFLTGYKSHIPMFESDSGEDDISSDEEMETDEIPMKNDEIKKPAAEVPMKDGKKGKQDIDDETPSGDDDFTDDTDSEMSEDESSDEEMSSGADLSDDSEDETDDSEEQTPTPKKPEVVGKKRGIEAVTPSGKKAKVEPSGHKTGDKKGARVSTPHPAKQASKTPADKSGKTPATDKKSKEKSPKSGSHACKSCSKNFGSETALESHKKAKHKA